MNKNKYPKIPTLCLCGCNEIVWGGSRFIRGHNSISDNPSKRDDIKEKISLALRGRNVTWGIKISSSKKGRPSKNKGRKTGKPSWNRGIPQSEETKKKASLKLKGHIPWNKGKKLGHCVNSGQFQKGNIPWSKTTQYSEESRKKMSLSHIGKSVNVGEKNGMFGKPSYWRGKKQNPEHMKRLIEANRGRTPWNKGKKLPEYSGLNHPRWRGGKKVANARMHHIRRMRGFKLIIKNNPYNEPIDYHHIHPNLPYVVPCPKRIHQMFPGSERTHFQNVNAMLGIKLAV